MKDFAVRIRENKKPILAAFIISTSIAAIMISAQLMAAGYTLILKTGLIPIEMMHTIVGVCACVIGGYLFVYFCTQPFSLIIRLIKNEKAADALEP